MNHYFTKSWQEFQAKRTRATTSTHAFQLPDVPFDIPAQVDHVIDRWQPRTRALIDEMQYARAQPRPLWQQAAHAGLPGQRHVRPGGHGHRLQRGRRPHRGSQEALVPGLADARRARGPRACRGPRLRAGSRALPRLGPRLPGDGLAGGRGHLVDHRPGAAELSVEGGAARGWRGADGSFRWRPGGLGDPGRWRAVALPRACLCAAPGRHRSSARSRSSWPRARQGSGCRLRPTGCPAPARTWASWPWRRSRAPSRRCASGWRVRATAELYDLALLTFG